MVQWLAALAAASQLARHKQRLKQWQHPWSLSLQASSTQEAHNFAACVNVLCCWYICDGCVSQVSLAGLWLMPAIISTMLKFWRFLFLWVCYSIVTGYLMTLCSHKKMHHSTPRKVGGCKPFDGTHAADAGKSGFGATARLQLQFPANRVVAAVENLTGAAVLPVSTCSFCQVACAESCSGLLLPVLLQVYAWFLGTYKVSVFVGMCGYFLLVLDMFGVGLLMARYVEPGGQEVGQA